MDQKKITHDQLLDLVSYDPFTGHFTSRGELKNILPGARLGCIHKTYGYRYIGIKGRSYRAHRLAWFYVHGEWPSHDVDHINGLRDDNRIVNLRLASNAQNQMNKKASGYSKSGLKGAHWNSARKKWQSYIQAEGRNISLGRFETPEAAHEAYVAAAIKYFGEFARAK